MKNRPWRRLIKVGGLGVVLLTAATVSAGAAELPQAIRHEFQTGSAKLNLGSDPAHIRLQGTNWVGGYASPYVRVFINGRGPFTFLFDTGSSFTVVSTKLVKDAGLQVISNVRGSHEIVKMADVRLGPVNIRDYFAVVRDGNDVDGILGFNAFGQDYLLFDFLSHELVVSSQPIPLARSFWLSYTLTQWCPYIDLTVNGKTLSTLIDTGDDAYAWEAAAADLKGLPLARRTDMGELVRNGVTGVTRTLVVTLDATLKVGPVSSEQPAVAINDSLEGAPDVGMDFMKNFTFEFDRHHKRVGFEPLFNGTHFTVPGLITIGFSISYRQPGRAVSDVLPGLAPSLAGMRIGDTIVKIDDAAADTISFQQWDTLLRARRPIRIEWSDRGSVQTSVFNVVELK